MDTVSAIMPALLDHPVVELVKRCEGWYDRPYLCPAGKWTIGYGHLCAKDHPPITREQGDALLRDDLTIAVRAVLRHAPLLAREPLHRLAALMSWTFNLGEGNQKSSTMLRRILEKEWEAAAREMTRWNKATVNGVKKVLPGLVKRRRCEAHLFRTGEVVLF
ncbi:MAG: lysozyme [Desulfovibrionaceae bacterium]|nr:lysozyme [Desulfovibrionaceae bacterium]